MHGEWLFLYILIGVLDLIEVVNGRRLNCDREKLDAIDR
jgi:hypothetical protein